MDSLPEATPADLIPNASVLSGQSSGELIRLNQVCKSFGPRTILGGLNWSLRRGETAVILGPSGAGKSVFLAQVLGFDQPDRGEVILGDALAGDPFRRVAVIFQDDALLEDRTVEANLAIAVNERADIFGGPFEPALDAAIDKALRDVGLDPERVRAQSPSHLSGGMRRRVALARALIRNPEILVADEPTTGLDPDTARGVYDLMSGLIRGRGMSAIIITHDPLCAAILGAPVYYFLPGAPEMARWEPDEAHLSENSETRRARVAEWAAAMRKTLAIPGAASPAVVDADARTDAAAGVWETWANPPIEAGLRAGLRAIDSLGRAILRLGSAMGKPSLILLVKDLRTWGLNTLPLVMLIFALLGSVMEVQVERSVGDVGFDNRVPELLAMALTRLAPVMTGFLIAGRCGSAVAALTGWRRLSGQDRALRTLRVNADRAFFPPILWSWVVSAPLLTWAGIVSGWAAAYVLLDLRLARAQITALYFADQFFREIEILDAVGVIVKSILMAAGLASIAYASGATDKRSATDLSKGVTRALVISFVWITFVDALISLALPI